MIFSDDICNEFISDKYGKEAVKFLKPAFMMAYDIITSSFYTLGTNISNHSKMDFDPYKSSYGRHVSGKWLKPPVTMVRHGVNREFHYWMDVIEHLAPPPMKAAGAALKTEAPFVLENKWVTAEERMDEEYLLYIIKEKKYGVSQAEKALKHVQKAENVLDTHDYRQVYNLFHRTLITARAYEAAATAYFGYRVYARGREYQTPWLKKTMTGALDKMLETSDEIDSYGEFVPQGQWNWRGDAGTLREYHDKITKTGWEEYGNVIFEP